MPLGASEGSSHVTTPGERPRDRLSVSMPAGSAPRHGGQLAHHGVVGHGGRAPAREHLEDGGALRRDGARPFDGGTCRPPERRRPERREHRGERRRQRGHADPRRRRDRFPATTPRGRGIPSPGCRTRPSKAWSPAPAPPTRSCTGPSSTPGASAAATSTPVTTASTALPRATASRAAWATCASEPPAARLAKLLLLVVAHDDAAARAHQPRPSAHRGRARALLMSCRRRLASASAESVSTIAKTSRRVPTARTMRSSAMGPKARVSPSARIRRYATGPAGTGSRAGSTASTTPHSRAPAPPPSRPPTRRSAPTRSGSRRAERGRRSWRCGRATPARA
jgi:hypothetical protein